MTVSVCKPFCHLPDQWKPLPKDERGMILAAKA